MSDHRLNHTDYVAIVWQPQRLMYATWHVPKASRPVMGPAERGNREDSGSWGGVQMLIMRHCSSTTATVAKTSLELAFFQTLSGFFHFAENVKCKRISLELISWESHSSLERERKNHPRLFMSSRKLETREIRLFHVIIMQWRLRNEQKVCCTCKVVVLLCLN